MPSPISLLIPKHAAIYCVHGSRDSHAAIYCVHGSCDSHAAIYCVHGIRDSHAAIYCVHGIRDAQFLLRTWSLKLHCKFFGRFFSKMDDIIVTSHATWWNEGQVRILTLCSYAQVLRTCRTLRHGEKRTWAMTGRSSTRLLRTCRTMRHAEKRTWAM